uniref:SFRICE_041323 n=1 Tax=Spodoptera frugiperda TaxID=7108 RepID=A0A2H1WT06_SPOFR
MAQDSTSIVSILDSWEERIARKFKEVQVQIQTAGTSKDTIARVAEDFRTFRELVFDMLKMLRLQVSENSRELDEINTRSRRKALIIQGVPEVASEDCTAVTLGVCNSKLGLSLTASSIKVSHRLGQASADHHRPVLVRFASTADKMKVWKAKAGLKGSSVVIKEFLTRTRQSVFERARQHFSMRACWTNNGVIHIRAPDGSRHKVTSMDGLDPLLSKYPRTQGKSPSAGRRPAESAGGTLKGARK